MEEIKENSPTYQALKDSTKLLPMIYGDVAQPSVKKVGEALKEVIELGTSIMLPIKLLNENIKSYFSKHLEKYKDHVSNIDDDNLIPVNPIVGIPIIDRLTYIKNEEIADL